MNLLFPLTVLLDPTTPLTIQRIRIVGQRSTITGGQTTRYNKKIRPTTTRGIFQSSSYTVHVNVGLSTWLYVLNEQIVLYMLMKKHVFQLA